MVNKMVFQKKLGTKIFIFTPKKIKINRLTFLLSFGPRVDFRGQKLKFLQKIKLKIFETIFFLNKKLPLVPRRPQKKFQHEGLLGR
jgi:hypothetical protein